MDRYYFCNNNRYVFTDPDHIKDGLFIHDHNDEFWNVDSNTWNKLNYLTKEGAKLYNIIAKKEREYLKSIKILNVSGLPEKFFYKINNLLRHILSHETKLELDIDKKIQKINMTLAKRDAKIIYKKYKDKFCHYADLADNQWGTSYFENANMTGTFKNIPFIKIPRS